MKVYNLSYEDIFQLATSANALAQSASSTASSAYALANAAMPKSGGRFTGSVHGVENVAWLGNSFRNAWVTDANGSGATTEYIWYRRQ